MSASSGREVRANRWDTSSDSLIGWRVRLPLDLLGQVFADCERWGIRLLADPPMGYVRPETRAWDYTNFHYVEQDVRAVAFNRAANIAVRLAYYDGSGSIVEHEIADLDSIAPLTHGRHEHPPPLEVTAYGGRGEGDTVSVVVSSRCDIWLPWHQWGTYSGGDALGDNRELALRHTPRLNGFLAHLRELARASGSDLELDLAHTDFDFRFEVDERGVLLDVEYHYERTTWEPFGEWYEPDLLVALRTAADRADEARPWPPYRDAIGANTSDASHALFAADRDSVLVLLRDNRFGRRLAASDDITAVRVRLGSVEYKFTRAELENGGPAGEPASG